MFALLQIGQRVGSRAVVGKRVNIAAFSDRYAKNPGIAERLNLLALSTPYRSLVVGGIVAVINKALR
ncbi:hypothetical protein ACSFA3_15065 [Variovorax sp. RHLX14]|uniref:hypothetical protein n=1 Tax=Variovorax sp. RHLX14 TaxID=1259731 RepID=UPI003F4843BC